MSFQVQGDRRTRSTMQKVKALLQCSQHRILPHEKLWPYMTHLSSCPGGSTHPVSEDLRPLYGCTGQLMNVLRGAVRYQKKRVSNKDNWPGQKKARQYFEHSLPGRVLYAWYSIAVCDIHEIFVGLRQDIFDSGRLMSELWENYVGIEPKSDSWLQRDWWAK